MTPEIRKLYGVYATPRPLVGFMVRSVHLLLQTKLGMLGGLADPEVRLLDPAAGTGNFLRAAGWKAIEHHMSRGGDPREIVHDHLLLLREVQPQGERNTKWLQDDYVKFLRLAQWRIDQTGEGIVALVVNHNCLDGITFRELRASLLRTFDEIYALDLHGNRRKRERAPDGLPDENVFPGVAQGAAVLFLIKRPE